MVLRPTTEYENSDKEDGRPCPSKQTELKSRTGRDAHPPCYRVYFLRNDRTLNMANSLRFTLIIAFAMLMQTEELRADAYSSNDSKPAPGFFRAPVLSMIHYYQTRISPNSIQRCPFETSCSHLAEEAVQRYGVMRGLIRTIDRYYFRENKQAFAIYERVDGGDGRLLLDDSAFLNSKGELPEQSIRPKAVSEKSERIVDSRVTAGLNEAQLLDWANQLYDQQEYQDAGLLYGRIEKCANNLSLIRACRQKRARCLMKERRFIDAVSVASLTLGDSMASEAERSGAESLIAYIYMQQRIFPLAETYFRKAVAGDPSGIATAGLGMVALEEGNWEKSDSILRLFEEKELSKADFLAEWRKSTESSRNLKLKSPLLAASMSAVVPGSGQLYCQHQFDGSQAFAFVAVFAYATYMAYRYESTFHKPRVGTVIGGSLTLAFYAANVWGARQTAIYRNMRIRDDVCAPMRVKYGELFE